LAQAESRDWMAYVEG